jgi:hypothetical protein
MDAISLYSPHAKPARPPAAASLVGLIALHWRRPPPPGSALRRWLAALAAAAAARGQLGAAAQLWAAAGCWAEALALAALQGDVDALRAAAAAARARR